MQGRVACNLLRGAACKDARAVQNNKVVRRAHFVGEMGGPQDGGAFIGEGVYMGGDRQACSGIQPHSRFIKQQHRRVMDQRARYFGTSPVPSV